MSDPSNPVQPTSAPAPAPSAKKKDEEPSVVRIISYPKIVFLYPTFVVALLAAIYLSIVGGVEFGEPGQAPAVAAEPGAAPEIVRPRGVTITTIFLIVLGVNLVILAFDFPRTISLTLFFFVVAVAMGLWLLFLKKPELLPAVTHLLRRFQPLANTTFFWAFVGLLGFLFVVSGITTRFDYWEVRRNELLHHHGILANLERFPAPNLRIDKEITDVFEYLLLGSGRLILQISSERRAVILDNVPFIRKKEAALTRMLGALHVEVADGDQGMAM